MDTNSTYKHWYEVNPSRLEMEKTAMAALFPEFELVKTNNGELQYKGTLLSDKFSRSEGYAVVMEYSNGGNINFGYPGMAVTPISPSFNELLPDEFPYTNKLIHRLLDDICIQNRFVEYEDPLFEKNERIITCASLLKRTIDWFVKYEAENERLRHESQKARDTTALKRQELRNRLKDILIEMPSPIKEKWYDKYPQLFRIRKDFLLKYFPELDVSIGEGSITGLKTGNVIRISGCLLIGIALNPTTKEPITYNINVIIDEYNSRIHLETERCNIVFISSVFGYIPLPFTQDYFDECNSSIATFFELINNAFEWLTLIEYGLNKELHSCFFSISYNNKPQLLVNRENRSKHVELNDERYIYQTTASRKRRELRSNPGYDPNRRIKLKKTQ